MRAGLQQGFHRTLALKVDVDVADRQFLAALGWVARVLAVLAGPLDVQRAKRAE